jgi:histidinol-phosphatase (PHP family)
MPPIDFFSDLHLHSRYSDGTGTIEQMAKAAIKKGLTTIAITDHMPLPFKTQYALDKNRLTAYRSEIDTVRQQYGHKLTILTGLEIEYIPEMADWIEKIAALGWDLLITSVHSLMVNNTHCLVNGSQTEFDNTLNHAFNGDIQAFCRSYYQSLKTSVATDLFDITGHLDVIKKHNEKNCYFDETSPWYTALIDETLDVLKTHNIKMEINTAGLNHSANQIYPSPWIIDAAINRGIPIVMGSDSHTPKTLGQYFHRIKTRFQ